MPVETAEHGSGRSISSNASDQAKATADDARGWLDAKVTMESWATRMIQQNQDLRSENEQLRRDKEELQKQHEKERRTHETEKELWQKFKDWWQDKLARENKSKSDVVKSSANQMTPMSAAVIRAARHTEQPHTPSASTSTSTALPRSSGNKLRLTPAEKTICEQAGMPTTASKASKTHDRRSLGYLPSPVTPIVRAHRKETQIKPSLSAGSEPSHPLRETTLSHENNLETGTKNDGKVDSDIPEHKSDPSNAARPQKSINAEYEIDPAKNDGKSYLHKTVVRNKTERKHMHAYDCECCRDYYNRIGPIAKRPFEDALGSSDGLTDEEAKQSRTNTPATDSKRASTASKEARSVQRHKQLTSRHRDYGPPPAATPPGYWDIQFPTTQKAQEINEQAKEKHEQKRRRMTEDPRFRRRVTTMM